MCGWRDARKQVCSVVFLLLRPNAFFLLPWRSIKHTDMKTWMMTLGLLTMAATMTAQDARMGSRNDGKGGAHRTHINSGEFYGTLVAFNQSNTEVVRFNIDDVVMRATRDPQFLSATKKLKTHRFESTSQALNVLASHGWVVRSTMVLRGRNGDERHYLMARPMDYILPLTPWLEEGSRDRSGQR